MMPDSSTPMPDWSSSSARRALATLPAVLWAAVIFSLSSRPTLPSPEVVGFDKVAHFGAFALLALLVVLALRVRDVGRRGSAWLSVAISCGYGVLDELHQSFVPGRIPDLFDLLADAAGAAVAVTVWYGALTGRRREERAR